MRPIDADALKRHMGIEDAVKYGNETEEQQHNSYATLMNYEIADFIDDMPTLDYALVRHGEWIMVSSDGLFGVCSECNRSDGIDSLATHCRYCGAKMDGKEDGKDENA